MAKWEIWNEKASGRKQSRTPLWKGLLNRTQKALIIEESIGKNHCSSKDYIEKATCRMGEGICKGYIQ